MNLSRTNFDHLVWGGLYTCKDRFETSLNTKYDSRLCDQRYKYWAPAYDQEADEAYMVNLYQMNGTRDYDTMVKKFESFKTDGYYAVRNCYNYYYHGNALLHDYNFSNFELALDLHDYSPIHERDTYDYLEKDIVRDVALYHEHAYPTGICLVRKGARKDSWNTIEQKTQRFLQSIHKPESSWDSQFKDEVKEWTDEGLHFNRKRVQAVLEYNELIEKILDEYRDELKEIMSRVQYMHDDEEDQFIVDMCENDDFGPAVRFEDMHGLYDPAQDWGTYYTVSLPKDAKCYIVTKTVHGEKSFALYLIPRQDGLENGKQIDSSTLFAVVTEFNDAGELKLKLFEEVDATKENYEKLMATSETEDPEAAVRNMTFKVFR